MMFAGSTFTIDAQFKDARSGAVYDPTVLTLALKSPSGAVTNYAYNTDAEIIRDAAGKFHADVFLGAAGQWHWKWTVADSTKLVIEGRVSVVASNIT